MLDEWTSIHNGGQSHAADDHAEVFLLLTTLLEITTLDDAFWIFHKIIEIPFKLN